MKGVTPNKCVLVDDAYTPIKWYGIKAEKIKASKKMCVPSFPFYEGRPWEYSTGSGSSWCTCPQLACPAKERRRKRLWYTGFLWSASSELFQHLNYHQSMSLKCGWTMWALLTLLDRDQCSCTLLPFNALCLSVLGENDFWVSICYLEWECTFVHWVSTVITHN